MGRIVGVAAERQLGDRSLTLSAEQPLANYDLPMVDDKPEPSKTEPTMIERAIAGGAMAGGSTAAAGSPPLVTLAAAAAGFALPYAEIVAHRVFDEFRSEARARVDTMLASADHELGDIGAERLADLASKSDQTQLLTAMAVDAAARTAWPPKVVALGRVLAAGLIAEDAAKIDEEQLALSAMADMERPHVSLLELLVNWEPIWRGQPGWSAQPYEDRRSSFPDMRWHRGRRTWTMPQIGIVRPRLAPVAASLMGTLQRHALAAQNDDTAKVLERFSQRSADDVNRRTRRQGGSRQQQVPALPQKISLFSSDIPEPSWSPTKLGEQVLGFYQLAAGVEAVEPE